MKKQIISALLAFALLLQVFTIPAFAADASATIEYDVETQIITISGEGLESVSPVGSSLIVLINDDLSNPFGANLAYLNQVVFEDGVLECSFESLAAFDYGDYINVYVDGNLIASKFAFVALESITIDSAKKLLMVTVDQAVANFATLAISPENATPFAGPEGGLTWTSNNPAIADVVDGELVVYKTGGVKLTATFVGYDANAEMMSVSTYITYNIR